ncbi:hypothetical protein BCR34DRAFT_572500 [Clohesyomyces aquaticus]|uniref:Uncharacterized protein n=1 Tax=Clohesyomyces aquaticus TaxID=1231657 RepID=A0A1Y1Z378_9PLEO|nr:hypothetical protein BCR34DRAFT_572500 [Clohesyomyces aquaticus]
MNTEGGLPRQWNDLNDPEIFYCCYTADTVRIPAGTGPGNNVSLQNVRQHPSSYCNITLNEDEGIAVIQRITTKNLTALNKLKVQEKKGREKAEEQAAKRCTRKPREATSSRASATTAKARREAKTAQRVYSSYDDESVATAPAITAAPSRGRARDAPGSRAQSGPGVAHSVVKSKPKAT